MHWSPCLCLSKPITAARGSYGRMEASWKQRAESTTARGREGFPRTHRRCCCNRRTKDTNGAMTPDVFSKPSLSALKLLLLLRSQPCQSHNHEGWSTEDQSQPVRGRGKTIHPGPCSVHCSNHITEIRKREGDSLSFC